MQPESAPRTATLIGKKSRRKVRHFDLNFFDYESSFINLPAVTLKARGTATLAAPAINKIEVKASHWREGRSHSNYECKRRNRERASKIIKM